MGLRSRGTRAYWSRSSAGLCPADSDNRSASQVSFLALRTPGSCLPALSCSTSSMKEWVNVAASCATGTGRRTVRFTKMAVVMEISDDEFGILEDERCIHTGIFQSRYLLHELVFGCSHPPPRRLHISFTILTQTEVALLLVLGV